MDGRGKIWVCVITAGCLVGAGCGDDGNTPHRSTSHPQTTPSKTTPSKTTRSKPPSLARPQYPRCRLPGFAEPKVMRVTGPGGGPSWQLNYVPPPLAAVRPDQTTNVLVIEESPALPTVHVKRGRPIVVAGRRVSFRAPQSKAGVFGAGWNTHRARYVVLANGKRPTTLRRFIACLP